MFSTHLFSHAAFRLPIKGALLATMLALLAGCATNTGTGKAEANLVEVDKGNFDRVYMQEDTPLRTFNSIAIEQPTVEMNGQWLRDHRGDYTERDLERIKEDYSHALRGALTQALQERAQLRVVEVGRAADVILKPSLRQLNIFAPDLTTVGRRDLYVETAGNATLHLEFIDPQTNQVLAQFVDHRETPPIVPGRLEQTNRGMNYHLFRRLMERWSRNLADYLVE